MAKTVRFKGKKSFTFSVQMEGDSLDALDGTWDTLEEMFRIEMRDAIHEVLKRHNCVLESSDSCVKLLDRPMAAGSIVR